MRIYDERGAAEIGENQLGGDIYNIKDPICDD